MLKEHHIAILESRGLDPELLTKLGWKSAERGKSGEWIAIPYFRNGVLVNNKYRTIIGEKRFSQDEGGEQCLYNLDCLLGIDKPAEVWITEGEMDCLSAYQCGYLALSVPNGAPDKPIDGGEDGKYAYLKEIKDKYPETVFILAVDSDRQGGNLLHDLSRILGPHRCKWVKYPKGCKDLNAAVEKYGSAAVQKVYETADWIAIDGIFRMSQLPLAPVVEPLPCMVDGLSEYIRLRGGDVIVVTGLPGGGKTTLVNEIMCNMAKHYGWKSCVGSFEQNPRADHLRYLVTYHASKPFHLIPEGGDTYNEAMKWIDNNFVFVIQNPMSETANDINWFLNLATAAVVRHGCKLVILDPWNELEHAKDRRQNITEYVGGAIKEIRKWAQKYMVTFVIVAHPAKMERNRDGVYPMPSLYDISDSAHWFNKPDLGIVVHRGENKLTVVRIAKVRYQGVIGKRGDVTLKYDDYRGVYEQPSEEDLLGVKETTTRRPRKKKVEQQEELL